MKEINPKISSKATTGASEHWRSWSHSGRHPKETRRMCNHHDEIKLSHYIDGHFKWLCRECSRTTKFLHQTCPQPPVGAEDRKYKGVVVDLPDSKELCFQRPQRSSETSPQTTTQTTTGEASLSF